jgi:imidazolonepropionase-like amidohydrolase
LLGRSGQKAALDSGVTTVRVLGVEHYKDVGLRELHRLGAVEIPEVIAAGYPIRPDMLQEFFLDFPSLFELSPKLAGASNIERVVKVNLDRDVEVIKVLATERAGVATADPNKRTFSDSELSAVVRAARGKKVAAHAHEAGGVKAAERSRPVFPYPVQARYSGTGDPGKPESFTAFDPSAR